MNRILATLVAAALSSGSMLAAGVAHAAPIKYDFAYSLPIDDPTHFPSGFNSASGVMTVVDQGGGAYLIVDISGEWNGETITGLVPVGVHFDNDNLIFPDSDPTLDGDGFAFFVAGPLAGDTGRGMVSFSFFEEDGYADEIDDSDYIQSFRPTRETAVPEPASWALMLLGVGGVGAGLRASRRKALGGVAPAQA
jgi:hypothetical protein